MVYFFSVPETFAPVILRHRANKLTAINGKIYKSQLVIKRGPTKLKQLMRIALSRPWILLATEPIVTVLSVYQAIIYATLYMCFGNVNPLSQG